MKIAAAIDSDPLRRTLVGLSQSSRAEMIFVSMPIDTELTECDAIFVEWRLERTAAPVLEILRMANTASPPKPVVVFVPKGDHALFRRAMASGAADVLYSPPERDEVIAEVEALMSCGHDPLDPEGRRLFETLRSTGLVGAAPSFVHCLERVKKAARSDANILLLGATGSGKDIMAQTIHALSRRRSERFEPVNCANLEGNLAASELFGHAKGAFTGADRTKDGWFTAVGAGTLFLDEIGDLDLSTQVKLLRAIEQRIFHRLGDTTSLQFHGRLICATLKDPDVAVKEGRLREDLLARIDQYRIVVPTLRQRQTDIRLLAWHFVQKHSRGRTVELSDSALTALEEYDYPKNVRGLESAIQAAITNTGNRATILPQDLPMEILLGPSRQEQARTQMVNIPVGLSYKDAREAALVAADRLYLNRFLEASNGNQSAAADAAGIDRKTFAERLARAREEREL
jgi:DNA-binding NtrC family response regulator